MMRIYRKKVDCIPEKQKKLTENQKIILSILKNYKKENRDPEITEMRTSFQYRLSKEHGWENLPPIVQDRKLEGVGISAATLRNRPYTVLQQLMKKGYITKYIDEKYPNWVRYKLKDEYNDIV